MDRPHVKIFSDRKRDRIYIYVNKEFAGVVVNNGFMPLTYRGKYTAMMEGKQLPVESKHQGILEIVFEHCILEGATPIE